MEDLGIGGVVHAWEEMACRGREIKKFLHGGRVDEAWRGLGDRGFVHAWEEMACRGRETKKFLHGGRVETAWRERCDCVLKTCSRKNGMDGDREKLLEDMLLKKWHGQWWSKAT